MGLIALMGLDAETERLHAALPRVTAAMIGLTPIMWSVGTGADVMRRVGAPMVGGLARSFALELLVYPPIYLLWKWHTEPTRFVRQHGPLRPVAAPSYEVETCPVGVA